MTRKFRYYLEDFCSFFLYPRSSGKKPYFLSLCCIVKDENEYLAEWIWYHRKIGVQCFYIFDNGSKVPAAETLKELVAEGIVKVNVIEGHAVQVAAYELCLALYGKESQWIGFIDTDEFIVPRNTTSLPDFLKAYSWYGGLGINWIMFGSGGNKRRPEEPQVKSFLRHTPKSYPANQHIKSLVQPHYTLRTRQNPHAFKFRFGKYCVNERKEGISGGIVPHHSDLIQINHYYTRSEEEFRIKIERGRGDGGDKRSMNDLYEIDAACTEQSDTRILEIAGLD
jgi:hypothetical protein